MDNETLLGIFEGLRAQSREAATVEFKSNWDFPTDIGQYLSALANAAALAGHDRAWLIWGVDDKSHAVKSTTFDPSAKKGEGNQPLTMWLTQKTQPRPDFQFHELAHPEGRIVMLEIHPPRSAPLAFDGVRYIRIDSNKTSLANHPDKEARLWAMLGQKDDWSSELAPGASLDDLDPAAIDMARKRFTEYLIKSEQDAWRHAQIRKEAAAWDISTLLNKARLTKQGRVTRSALLLLGRDESAHFLSPVDAKISWILRDASNQTINSQHFGMPLLLSSDKIFSYIRNINIEHMPGGTLFPTAVQQYDAWVIREALHNCVAHQDYRLGGKINVVEHPGKLIFTNLGQFIPPSVEWMLEHQSPPEHYRNQWLIDGMIRLRMIDQVGSGIRRMFVTQRERFFPLPDYAIDATESSLPRVEVSIPGQILDVKYSQVLMKRSDLDLRQVFLLDRVQKHKNISTEGIKELRVLKLIEGRAPNLYVSAKVADWTNQKVSYIRNRAFDDDFYQRLVIEYLQQFKQASRKDLEELLLPKLPEVLTLEQKHIKVLNLLQGMRKNNLIERVGPKATAVWKINKLFNKSG